METAIITHEESIMLLCAKLTEQLSSEGLKKTCAELLGKSGLKEAKILLALKGIKSESDLTDPAKRRYVRRLAEEMSLPYEELMSHMRQVITN